MSRRRMIDPGFWSDGKVKKLSITERLLFLGLISHADDEGRLQASPAFLRSIIFPYDDYTLEQISEMLTHITQLNLNVQLYTVEDEDYISFARWARYQKPSHPQPSRFPKPPFTESIRSENGLKPSQSRSGQSSLGKVRLGQGSSGNDSRNPFSSFPDLTDSDLTDFLTKNLSADQPAGKATIMEQIGKMWQAQFGTKMESSLWQIIYAALATHSPLVLAVSLSKLLKYGAGKTKPHKYFQTVLAEHEKKGA